MSGLQVLSACKEQGWGVGGEGCVREGVWRARFPHAERALTAPTKVAVCLSVELQEELVAHSDTL